MMEGASLLNIPKEKQENTQLHPLLLNNDIPLMKQDASPHPLLRGPRRVARLCVCAVLVPAVLITVPLYVRLVLYPPVQYPMMPSDQRLTDSLVSSFWCQSQWVHMNGSFNVYSSNTPFHTTPPRPALNLLHSVSLRDDEKEYWGFHLLQGSTVTVSACATNDGGQVMILRGVENLRRCAWIRQAASKEEVNNEDEDGLKDDATHFIHHPAHVDEGGGRVGDGEWMHGGAPFVGEDGELVVDEGEWVEEEEGEWVERGGGLLHDYPMDGGLLDVEEDGERVEGGGAMTDDKQVEEEEEMDIMKVEDEEEIHMESGNASDKFQVEKSGISLNISDVDEGGESSGQSTQPPSTSAPLNITQDPPSPSRLRNQGVGPKDPFSDPHNSTQDQNEDQQREFTNTDHNQDRHTEFKTTNQTQERPDQPQDRPDQNQERPDQNQERPDQNQDTHRDFSHTDPFHDRQREFLTPGHSQGRPDQHQDTERDFSHRDQNQDRQRGFQSPDRSQKQRGYHRQTADQSKERERDLVQLLRRVLRLSKNKKEILRILHSLGRSETRQLPKHIQRKLGIRPETQDSQDTTQRDRRAVNMEIKDILSAIHSLGSSDIQRGQGIRPEAPDNHAFRGRHRREVHSRDEDGAFEEYDDDDDDDDDVPMGGAGKKRSRMPDGDGGRRSRGHAAVKAQVRSKVEGQVGSKLVLPEGWFKVERGYFKHRNKDDMSDEENVSSYSSSEEALAACDGVVATLPLRAYRGCSGKWVGMNRAVYEVPKSANYYLVFWSDNEIATNTLHFNLSLTRVQYDTRDATLVCHNSTQCSVPLSFFSHTYVVVEMPSDASYLTHAILHTSCQSRVPVFLVFLILAPLLILFCAFQ